MKKFPRETRILHIILSFYFVLTKYNQIVIDTNKPITKGISTIYRGKVFTKIRISVEKRLQSFVICTTIFLKVVPFAAFDFCSESNMVEASARVESLDALLEREKVITITRR